MLICIILGVIALAFLITLIINKSKKASYMIMLILVIIPFLFNIKKLFGVEENFVGINKMVFLIISAIVFLISIIILSRNKSLKLHPLLLLNFGILIYLLNRSVLQVGGMLTLSGEDLKLFNRIEFIKTSLLLLIQMESFFMMREKIIKKQVKSAKN